MDAPLLINSFVLRRVGGSNQGQKEKQLGWENHCGVGFAGLGLGVLVLGGLLVSSDASSNNGRLQFFNVAGWRRMLS